jgi:hypothetical protein
MQRYLRRSPAAALMYDSGADFTIARRSTIIAASLH